MKVNMLKSNAKKILLKSLLIFCSFSFASLYGYIVRLLFLVIHFIVNTIVEKSFLSVKIRIYLHKIGYYSHFTEMALALQSLTHWRLIWIVPIGIQDRVREFLNFLSFSLSFCVNK